MVVQRMVADSSSLCVWEDRNVLVSQIEKERHEAGQFSVICREGHPALTSSQRYGAGQLTGMAVALVKWSACGHRRSSPLLWRRPWENSGWFP